MKYRKLKQILFYQNPNKYWSLWLFLNIRPGREGGSGRGGEAYSFRPLSPTHQATRLELCVHLHRIRIMKRDRAKIDGLIKENDPIKQVFSVHPV